MVAQYTTGPVTYQIRYRAANGDVLDFTDGSRWIATGRHGFGGDDFHAFTSRGVRQSGDTLVGLYANPRVLEVPVTIFAGRGDVMNALRRRIADAMNPDLGDGLLEYTDEQIGDIWTINVRPQMPHLDTAAKQAVYKEETFRWDAHDPLWYGDALTFAVPVNNPAQTLNFLGQMPVGFTLLIPCPLTPPISIINVSGGVTYQLQFPTGSYASGNTVKIVTLFNQKSAVIYPTASPSSTTDIFPNRGLGSIYWQLRRGANVLQITTGNSAEHPAAVLTYQPTRLGV